MRRHPRFSSLLWAVLFAATLAAASARAQTDAPIIHTIRLASADQQTVEIQTTFPNPKKAALEVMMPVWSPGFYVVQDYADKISDLTAKSPSGKSLEITHDQPNRWKIAAADSDSISLTYRLKCERASVTTNFIGDSYAVFNGGATYLTTVGENDRPHHVRFELPDQWHAFSGLESAGSQPNEFIAADYDTLVDSPIIAGKNLGVHEFEVDGAKHVLVDAGEHPGWDGQKAVDNLQKLIHGMHAFWGDLPFERYVFLNMHNNGGGGLEHKNSTLISTRANPNATGGEPWSNFGWLAFVSHEYFHTFNVKRLRPIELGPFDYERPPRTPSLWISEGLTSYYGDLITVRSGLGTPQNFLRSMSSYIGQLQTSPGRLKQSLENASLDVWTSGMSGVGRDRDNTISYYVKGPIVGFLLDAKIRRTTAGQKSLDDVMRLAYQRYSGQTGFTPVDFVSVAEEVCEAKLGDWFKKHLASTDELDYAEALDWFGLEFGSADDSKLQWSLSVKADATDEQKAHFAALTKPDAAPTGSPK